MDLIFDAERHHYYIDGRRVPGVTSILVAAGICKPQFYKPGADKKGTAIHEATQEMDVVGTDIGDYPAEIRGYLTAWRNALEAENLLVQQVELQLGCLNPAYAGTADRIVDLEGTSWILDIKSGAKAAWHSLQVAGYGFAAKEAGINIDGGLVIYLKNTGKHTASYFEGQAFAHEQLRFRHLARKFGREAINVN